MRAFTIIKGRMYLVRWLVKSEKTMVEVKTRIVEGKSKYAAIMAAIDAEIELNKGAKV